MNNMNDMNDYETIDKILANIEMKFAGDKNSSSVKFKGSRGDVCATLYSKETTISSMYSVKIISKDGVVADLSYERSRDGKIKGDAYAMIFFAKYAVPEMQNRILCPLQEQYSKMYSEN